MQRLWRNKRWIFTIIKPHIHEGDSLLVSKHLTIANIIKDADFKQCAGLDIIKSQTKNLEIKEIQSLQKYKNLKNKVTRLWNENFILWLEIMYILEFLKLDIRGNLFFLYDNGVLSNERF